MTRTLLAGSCRPVPAAAHCYSYAPATVVYSLQGIPPSAHLPANKQKEKEGPVKPQIPKSLVTGSVFLTSITAATSANILHGRNHSCSVYPFSARSLYPRIDIQPTLFRDKDALFLQPKGHQSKGSVAPPFSSDARTLGWLRQPNRVLDRHALAVLVCALCAGSFHAKREMKSPNTAAQ